MMRKRLLLSLIVLMLLNVASFAQEGADRPSPLAISSMRYKEAYAKITYSRPHKHDRQIFGKLVPYGQVWRTGANEATEITVTQNMQIQGNLLKAGTYSIFTIPEKDTWTIIINTELGLWGSYNHNPKLDLLRLVVPVKRLTEINEQFTMRFEQRNELADLVLLWDDVRISIPFKFIN